MPTVLAVDSVRGDSVIGDRDEPDVALSETEAGAAFCFASDRLLIGAMDRHLLCRVRTLSESEFARPHRLRDRCAFAAQFEGGGLRDARIDTPTPS